MEHSSHHYQSDKSDKVRINLWQILTLILAILLIASIFTYGFRFSANSFKLSNQQAEEKVTGFINENIPGVTASVVSTSRESGVYKLILSANGQEGESYLSA